VISLNVKKIENPRNFFSNYEILISIHIILFKFKENLKRKK
jgi:hypothetical protein